MVRILLQNCHFYHNDYCEVNRGDAAWMIGTLEALKNLIPEAEFVTFMQYSKAFSERHGIKVVKSRLFAWKSFSLLTSVTSSLRLLQCALWAIFHKCLHVDVKALVNGKHLREYRKATIILDMSTLLTSDDFGFISVIEHCKDILIPILLGKPVMIYAQSPGPFRNKMTSWLVKIAFNKASLITLREETRKSYLEEIGITKPPIYVVPDPGFLLEPASKERIQEILSAEGIDRGNKPLMGLVVPEGELFGGSVYIGGNTRLGSGYRNVVKILYNIALYCLPEGIFQRLMSLGRRTGYYSNLKSQFRDKTINNLTQIAGHLAERYKSTVLLIPHNIYPGARGRERIDDGRIVVEAIHQRVSHNDKIIPLVNEYTAEELKGIIGQCDLLVSTKKHGWVAGVTQCVPTIAIGTRYQFLGFMQMMGQEEWLCEQMSTEEVLAKIEEAWIRKEEIKEELKAKLGTVREKALFNARLVKELLDSEPE